MILECLTDKTLLNVGDWLKLCKYCVNTMMIKIYRLHDFALPTNTIRMFSDMCVNLAALYVRCVDVDMCPSISTFHRSVKLCHPCMSFHDVSVVSGIWILYVHIPLTRFYSRLKHFLHNGVYVFKKNIHLINLCYIAHSMRIISLHDILLCDYLMSGT